MQPCSPNLLRMPPNSNDSLTALIVSKLVVADPRYDIRWAYGPFLDEIPKRLGQSDALDAATKALMLTIPMSAEARRDPPVQALQSYTAAIGAIRRALSRRETARCMDTMCATYFLLLCQVRMTSIRGSC